MKTKVANRKSIYSGSYDLFSTYSTSLTVFNFNWLCYDSDLLGSLGIESCYKPFTSSEIRNIEFHSLEHSIPF